MQNETNNDGQRLVMDENEINVQSSSKFSLRIKNRVKKSRTLVTILIKDGSCYSRFHLVH